MIKEIKKENILNFSEQHLGEEATKVLSQIGEKLHSKGNHYSDGKADSALKNFFDSSEFLGVSIPFNIMTLATKHWYVLCQWSRGNRKKMDRHKLRGMLIDIVVYMVILIFYLDNCTYDEEDK